MKGRSLLECISEPLSVWQKILLCTLLSSKRRMSQSWPPSPLAWLLSLLLEWSCQPYKLSVVGQKGTMPHSSGQKMGEPAPGKFCVAKNQYIFRQESARWSLWGACSPGVAGACSRRMLLKNEMGHLIQMSRTERQILVHTINVTINSILIKPREKGKQNLESVNKPFKFSLLLIVDQLSPLKCLRKVVKILGGMLIRIKKNTSLRKLLLIQ